MGCERKSVGRPLGLAFLLLAACTAMPLSRALAADTEALSKDFLAKVGSWTMTVDEFNDKVRAVKGVVRNFDENNLRSRQMVLDEVIRQQLLAYEARQLKLEEKPEIRSAVKDFETNLIVADLAKAIARDIRVSEGDALNYYDAHPNLFLTPVEKKVLEIVAGTSAEARDILVQVLQGGDFRQLARNKSRAKSASDGGDLGYLLKAPFEQMHRTVEPMKKDDVSAVFEGPDGFYIVKVEDVRGGDKKLFSDIKEDLVKALTNQKQQQAVQDRVNEIAKKIKVQVNPELLKDQ
jgi:parvulin-like peptidyl-prolyl isomerase